MLICSKKYWCKDRSCLSVLPPEQGWMGPCWFCTWAKHPMDLCWAMGSLICCRVFQQESSSRSVVRDNGEKGFSRLIQGKSWHVGISGFCCGCWKGWNLKGTWANKSIKGLKSSSYLSTVQVPGSQRAGSGASWHSVLCIAHRHYASKMTRMLFPGNGFELQSVGNKEKHFARKSGCSSAFIFDSYFNLCTVNSIKMDLVEFHQFCLKVSILWKFLGEIFTVILKSECRKEHFPQNLFKKSLKGLFSKGK